MVWRYKLLIILCVYTRVCVVAYINEMMIGNSILSVIIDLVPSVHCLSTNIIPDL